MTGLLAARLSALTHLDAPDIAELVGLASEPRPIAREQMFVGEGEEPARLHILRQGWAARVKMLPDGRRYLSALLLPGDICDIDGLQVAAYDYGVVAMTRCEVATVDRDELLALCGRRPAIARVLSWFGFVDNSLLNEAAASLALRSARERLIYLFCELRARLAAIGQASPTGFELPLTQHAISEVLGITPVHVNRTLKALSMEGLAVLSRQSLSVPDWQRLAQEADFSPSYLHLEGMRRGSR